MNPEQTYLSIGRELPGAVESQLFGKPCFKVNGKAFISFFQHEMVFKLTGDTHKEALSLDGSQLFDPSGKKRPMKEWIQVSFHYQEHWQHFAQEALNYVSGE
ncbi:MAG: hypothetical protein A3D31_08000 [Candidatus Fluviicola riflensis]|nr:MAG: hypothetical protein CHH17_07010 [Candidatus Fluviicola riflensis]OGS79883.1 MAG: hypothetical protein A3D31_08000 [Candidatus Fluviicola riflensis]OGS82398.1 MAG: hypothetical protein A2724_16945 [Fluviicola sp. RIFCSPHIGHO2_01_FULL_43_53]OGS88062.1 MAG: hypothetical protein A3E30_14380 [Fluviicola sp. RIFCSPHIGHO2_12_FULL_43_24]